MNAPLVIELANNKEVAAYTVALAGMLEEDGENPADYIDGVGDFGDGRWVVKFSKPISIEWHLGITNAVKKMNL